MKTFSSKPIKCLVALFAGWIAAGVSFGVPYTMPMLLKDGDHSLETVFISFLFPVLITGALFVPCWLLIVVPLVAFLRSKSDFWRPHVSIPFGGIFGLIITYPVAQIFWSGVEFDAKSVILLAAFSGAASGATTLGVISFMNRKDLKIAKNMTLPNPATNPAD
ncbi:MAG TPA: hypothetical protein VH280_00895 [Verrucomicrobiae bacterium]|jgi:glucan phosphoethanolaminetransferase (alkaline phosphatase superfamily)|nr:hypothetical protein [Verrucomicrobiae bacterium]